MQYSFDYIHTMPSTLILSCVLADYVEAIRKLEISMLTLNLESEEDEQGPRKRYIYHVSVKLWFLDICS